MFPYYEAKVNGRLSNAQSSTQIQDRQEYYTVPWHTHVIAFFLQALEKFSLLYDTAQNPVAERVMRNVLSDWFL
jgi:hypothetical protein